MSVSGCILWCVLVGTPIVGSLVLKFYDRAQQRAEQQRAVPDYEDDDDCACRDYSESLRK